MVSQVAEMSAHVRGEDVRVHAERSRVGGETPRVKDEQGRWRERSPALAARLTDHVWA